MFTLLGQKEQTNQMAYNPIEWQYRDGRPRQTLDPNEIEDANDMSNPSGFMSLYD